MGTQRLSRSGNILRPQQRCIRTNGKYPARIRVKSPSKKSLQPDTQITIRLLPVISSAGQPSAESHEIFPGTADDDTGVPHRPDPLKTMFRKNLVNPAGLLRPSVAASRVFTRPASGQRTKKRIVISFWSFISNAS